MSDGNLPARAPLIGTGFNEITIHGSVGSVINSIGTQINVAQIIGAPEDLNEKIRRAEARTSGVDWHEPLENTFLVDQALATQRLEQSPDARQLTPARWRPNFSTLRVEHPEFVPVWPLLEEWFDRHGGSRGGTVAVDELTKDLSAALDRLNVSLLDLLFAIRAMTKSGMLRCTLRLRRHGNWLDGDYDSLESVSRTAPELMAAKGVEVVAVYSWSSANG